jgi:hypothetical protein
MTQVAATPETLVLRTLVGEHREESQTILDKCSATNPKVLGSVAQQRGTWS